MPPIPELKKPELLPPIPELKKPELSVPELPKPEFETTRPAECALFPAVPGNY